MRARVIAKLTCIPLLCTALLLAAASCGRESRDANGPPVETPHKRKIVLVGLDAADWLAIDPLIRAGKLPAFERLRKFGRTGVMAPTPPLISPMLWTTIATGVEPENHGILDFMADSPNGRQVPVGSSQRLAPALWNLFSNAGRRVGVVGWWATWPAERVNGTIVSDALAPQLTRHATGDVPSITSPATAEQAVRRHVVDVATLSRADLASYVRLDDDEFQKARAAYAQSGKTFYSNRLAHLGSIIAGTRTYGGIAEELLKSERPDLLAMYFEAIDTVSHLFVRDSMLGPAAIERAYVDADALLQRLARASAPDTLFIVCSDHGFYPATAGISENPADLAGPATAWHRPYGIVAVTMAGSIVMGTSSTELSPGDAGTIRPVDVAPTILHAAGLAVPSDMPGRVLTSLLPADAAGAEPRRSAPTPYRPPPVPRDAKADVAAIERLQALGYIAGARTSLARQNLGENLFRRGKLAEAERELRAVTDAQPGNVPSMLWLAQALVKQGRAEDALAVYERAIAVSDGARDALVQAVDLALANDDIAAARRLIASARSAPPAVVLVARGAIAQARGDPAGAERAWRSALNVDPLSFDAAARLLDLLSASGHPGSVRTLIERAVRVAPDSPRHLALLGQLRLQMGEGPAAEAALRRALELAPEGTAVRLALARALLMQQKAAAAEQVLLPLPPSHERDVLLGSACSAQGKWKEAALYLRAALDSSASTPDVTVLNGLGWAELQLGRRDEAAQLFARSLTVDARQPAIRRLLDDVRNEPRSPLR